MYCSVYSATIVIYMCLFLPLTGASQCNCTAIYMQLNKHNIMYLYWLRFMTLNDTGNINNKQKCYNSKTRINRNWTEYNCTTLNILKAKS